MAVSLAVACPNCEKKFKPKGDVQGKKIKCPFCKDPFVVPAAKNGSEAKSAKVKAAEVKPPREEPPAPVAAPPVEQRNPDSDFDTDDNPYAVKNQDLTPRCPHCAKELQSANAVVCIYCGY